MEELTAEFVRKPFSIQAVRVTSENMDLVAKWCGGEIQTRESSKTRFIKVEVNNPLSVRQTMAYVGDWVMFAGKSYKVYNDTAFHMSFEEKRKSLSADGTAAVEVLIDLDEAQPALVLKKGHTTCVFDALSLFEGMSKVSV